jgi:predicted Fe-S protein YdhL (DUF1289 family)
VTGAGVTGNCVPRRDPYVAGPHPAVTIHDRLRDPRRISDPMSEIESPCNKVCVVDPLSTLCVGCGRTLAEIEGWIRLSADERARVMAELPRRLAAQSRSEQVRTS